MPTALPRQHHMPSTRVLVADDYKNFRRVLSDLLKDEGFEVQEAADGDALLRLAIARPPHAIVVDASVLADRALDVLRTLRRVVAESEIILISTFLDNRTREAAAQYGVRWLLEKPFTVEALLEALHSPTER